MQLILICEVFFPTTISNVPYKRAIIDVLLHAYCSYCTLQRHLQIIFRLFFFLNRPPLTATIKTKQTKNQSSQSTNSARFFINTRVSHGLSFFPAVFPHKNVWKIFCRPAVKMKRVRFFASKQTTKRTESWVKNGWKVMKKEEIGIKEFKYDWHYVFNK